MLLSVIIPVLNEAERIGSLVSYLRTHGGSSVLEILVIDAGSTDDTVREAQKSGATVLHSPVCSRAAQMNTGAKAAKGDVLYFVHADTCPPESFPLDIEKGLESGYQMGCYRYQFDSPGFLLKINAYFNRFHWLWCQGGDKTFFIRRNIFHDLGGYDEFYVIMEEYDFLRRAMPLFKLLIVPKYAVVSARKYRRNGWFRVQFANMVVFNLFRLGISPLRLKAVYKTMLR